MNTLKKKIRIKKVTSLRGIIINISIPLAVKLFALIAETTRILLMNQQTAVHKVSNINLKRCNTANT